MSWRMSFHNCKLFARHPIERKSSAYFSNSVSSLRNNEELNHGDDQEDDEANNKVSTDDDADYRYPHCEDMPK